MMRVIASIITLSLPITSPAQASDYKFNKKVGGFIVGVVNLSKAEYDWTRVRIPLKTPKCRANYYLYGDISLSFKGKNGGTVENVVMHRFDDRFLNEQGKTMVIDKVLPPLDIEDGKLTLSARAKCKPLIVI